MTTPEHDTADRDAGRSPTDRHTARRGKAPGPDGVADSASDADPGAVVAAGSTWRIERIDTEPMTEQQHDNAVRALAALIGAWRDARASGDAAQPPDRAA